MKNKKCIIIHWCPDDSDDITFNKHWIPWTKQELVSNGIEVIVPLMPYPWKPDYQTFKTEFEKLEIDKNTILVGHSCWGAFLVRWLWETKKEILKLILVAPWKEDNSNNIIRKNFYTFKIDDSIRNRVEEVVIFTSDNEEEIWKKSMIRFNKVLGWQIINLENHWHYTLGDMWKEEFPELVDIILSK